MGAGRKDESVCDASSVVVAAWIAKTHHLENLPLVNAPTSTFLGQNIKSNTFQLQYDFTKRITGRIGYVYTDRTIADYSAAFYSAETYFPGGAGGTAGNDYFAAGGDCAVSTACTATVDPTTGQLISLTFSGPASGNDTSRNITGIPAKAPTLKITLIRISTRK